MNYFLKASALFEFVGLSPFNPAIRLSEAIRAIFVLVATNALPMAEQQSRCPERFPTGLRIFLAYIFMLVAVPV